MTTHNQAGAMSCENFSDVLSAYLEGELDATQTAAVEAHAASCADCGALLADLQHITNDAAALPVLAPSRDLWTGIEARIETPVISIAERPQLVARNRQWLVAAALVFVTASVTYVATKRFALPAASSTAVATVAPSDQATLSEQAAQAAAQVERTAIDSTTVTLNDPKPTPRPGVERAPVVTQVTNTERADAAGTAVDSLYGREISRLRLIIARRSASLDPGTVAVIELNLGIIDSAIVRSRAALARDPASGFLTEQLTTALEKKVELLRTVATLPARS
jgi:anti-sigma factor RsiW